MIDYTPLLNEMDISPDSVDAIFDGVIPGNMEIGATTLAALRAGSHEAYTEVFKSYHTPVRKFLAKMIRNDEDAQELTQDVFYQLWVKHEQIDPSKNIKGFLYSTARYYMLNYFRHKKVVVKYGHYMADGDATASSPDEHYIAGELNLLAEIAIARMPRQQQAVFRMRHQECKSHEEIAELLNTRPETVRVHLSRGRQEIKEILLALIAFLMVY